MAIYNPNFSTPENVNSGTVLNGGIPYQNNPSAAEAFYNKRRVNEFPFGSTLVDGVNITGNNQNFLLPVPYAGVRSLIKRSTKTIAGQLNDVLLTSGCIQPELRSSIHYINSYHTRLEHQAYNEGRFNNYTGKFAAGYPDNQIDFFGPDEAAVVSREHQGRLFFKNSKTVSIANYPSKTG